MSGDPYDLNNAPGFRGASRVPEDEPELYAARAEIAHLKTEKADLEQRLAQANRLLNEAANALTPQHEGLVGEICAAIAGKNK